jgi:hypothetical protein
VSLFLSEHHWTTWVPSEEEVEAVMQLGDAGPLAIPGIFPYVEGMPIIVNQDKCLGLKVANGSEFTAVGIVPDPNVQEHVVDEGLSIFFGPSSGILLQSQALRGVRIRHLPPDTIMLGTELIPLLKDKHPWEAYMPGPVPKARLSNGGVETRPALYPRFCADGLQVAVADGGKGTVRLYGRRCDYDECDIIGSQESGWPLVFGGQCLSVAGIEELSRPVK